MTYRKISLRSFCLALIVGGLGLGVSSAFAQADQVSQFHTALTSTYTVNPTGETIVKSDFTITNTTSTAFVSRYAIQLNSTRIPNIRVTSGGEELPATITAGDQQTTIGITFPDKVVGKDQQRTFSIEYTDPEVAIVSPQTAEINIPAIATPDQFQEYTLEVLMPNQYGFATITHPPHSATSEENGFTKYEFVNVAQRGATLFFGTKQSYSFQMSYLLSNPTGNRGVVQVVLLPDTTYQRVSYDQLTPSPETISTDNDGNWIATYTLDSQQQQQLIAEGQIDVFLQPRPDFQALGPTLEHVKEQPYWEKSQSVIQEVRKQAPTALDVFRTVTNHLSFNYLRVDNQSERTGAVFAYNHPSNAIAQDYSDLFITIARANNIPARQISGYAISNSAQLRPLTTNGTFYHSWAEFFNHETRRWQAVDPTWSDTVGSTEYFDYVGFHHITLATQGESSTKPLPPGLNGQPGIQQENFAIQRIDHSAEPSLDLTMSVNLNLSTFFGVGSKYDVSITNNTGQAWYNLPIQLSATNGLEVNPPQRTLDRILPYQTDTIPVKISSSNFVDAQEGNLTIEVDGIQSTHQVQTSSFVDQLKQNPLLLGGVIGLSLVVLLLIAGVIYLIFKKGKKKKKKK